LHLKRNKGWGLRGKPVNVVINSLSKGQNISLLAIISQNGLV